MAIKARSLMCHGHSSGPHRQCNQRQGAPSRSRCPLRRFATHVRSLLGSRPSRPATLLHNCASVGDVQAAPGDRLQLMACIGMRLSQGDRAQRLQELQDSDAGSDFDSDDSEHVRQVFADFSEVERDDSPDDAELVSAAARRDGCCLESASDQCRDDRNIVLAAARQYSETAAGSPATPGSSRASTCTHRTS